MIRPWEAEVKNYTICSKRTDLTYDCIQEPMGDERTLWKRGDIIKFGSCYFNSYDYKDWFLKEEDKFKYMIKRPNIPMYASYQYAVMMCRYRVTKNKGYATYRDYGTHVMFISGTKPGRLKKYFATTPFNHIASFPYVDLSEDVKKIFSDLGIDKLPNELCKLYDNTTKARTLFASILQDKLSEVYA